MVLFRRRYLLVTMTTAEPITITTVWNVSVYMTAVRPPVSQDYIIRCIHKCFIIILFEDLWIYHYFSEYLLIGTY